MRTRMLLGLLVGGAVVAGSVLAESAGAARRASAQRARHTFRVTISLPSLGASEVSVITFTATAARGRKVSTPRVRTVNDARLSDPSLGNVRIAYIGEVPRKKSARETLKLQVLINRFSSTAAGPSRFATSAATTPPDVVVQFDDVEDDLGGASSHHISEADCHDLQSDDGLFESGETELAGPLVGGHQYVWKLFPGRNANVQPSPPEDVLDHAVANAWTEKYCPKTYKPEGADGGPT